MALTYEVLIFPYDNAYMPSERIPVESLEAGWEMLDKLRKEWVCADLTCNGDPKVANFIARNYPNTYSARERKAVELYRKKDESWVNWI